MQSDPGQTWDVGAIANGYLLAHDRRWVRLNSQGRRAGSWQAGDVANGHAFTGANWVPLPAGWRPDPSGRYQFRWWTGGSWGSPVQTNGLRFDDPMVPVIPPPPPTVIFHPQPASTLRPGRAPLGFIDVLDISAWILYGGFWLAVAVFSAVMAASEHEPRYLLLTSTASLNIFLYKLTGKTRSELNRRARRAAKRNLPYLVGGGVAAFAVWLGIRFDDPKAMVLGLFIALAAAMFAWAVS